MFAFLLAVPLARGAEPTIEEQLAALEDRQDRQIEDLDQIIEGSTDRVGLLSAREAEQRFEDAVFTAMMGDYENAALEFFILADSGAVISRETRSLAEWYLAETLFELQNYVIAEEIYLRIAERGRSATFFSDAVRRLLEVYGITNDEQKFDHLYRKYIATRSVEPTELINYTLAKSFYRQGDWVRAKSLFSEFPRESDNYAKARYFLGTILVRQGKLEDAVVEFEAAAAIPVTTPELREVVDLANLALGRVQYELGNYRRSSDAYEQIRRDSRYFADKLYEIVWSYIKQEDYEQALQNADIFLLAFPDHRYAARLKVLKGHLHMKQERYESAHSIYEKVVAEYSPIRDLVSAVEVSHQQPRVFFERLVKEDALELLNRAGLPPFAAELLYEQQNVAQAVEIRQELENQERELDKAALVIEELESALLTGVQTLGSFRNARESVRWILKDRLDTMDSLIILEEQYLLDNTGGSARNEVQRLRDKRQVISEVVGEVRARESRTEDREAAYLEQIRAVQTQAFLVEQVALDLLEEVRATRDYMSLGRGNLQEDELDQVREQLEEIESVLNGVIDELQPLRGEATLRKVIGVAGVSSEGSDPDTESGTLEQDYRALRQQYRGLRDNVSALGAREFFTRVDDLWSNLDRLERQGRQALATLDEVEQEEITRIRQGLAREATVVANMSSDVDLAVQEADALGEAATREGFTALTAFFDESVMRADMGIVDVYWARKILVSDQIVELKQERIELLDDLNRRFQALNAKLEE